MDSDSEERERGITKKFGHARFHPQGYNYTLLDAPGHLTISALIIIAIQQSNNVCTIVADCSGGFESSFAGHQRNIYCWPASLSAMLMIWSLL